MNKSAQSCIWSIRSLLEKKKIAYLWTFTFRDVLEIPEACSRWQHLQRDLVRSVGFRGVRVYELHPGGHGLHIHVVTSGRHDVRAVRHFSGVAGFGRIHVKPIAASSADYIAKYLTKAKRSESLKGRRLWSCLGFTGSKVKDCELDSPLSRAIKKISDSDVRRHFRRNNWAFPTNYKSFNFIKFIMAQAGINDHRMKLFLRIYPKSSRSLHEKEGKHSVDELCIWSDELIRKQRFFNDVLEASERWAA